VAAANKSCVELKLVQERSKSEQALRLDKIDVSVLKSAEQQDQLSQKIQDLISKNTPNFAAEKMSKRSN
jgi:hypothetical protein